MATILFSLLGAVLALVLSACGATHANTPARARTSVSVSAKRTAGLPATLRVGASTILPAAVQLPAVAPASGGALSIGGLDANDSSVAGAVLIDASGAR